MQSSTLFNCHGQTRDGLSCGAKGAPPSLTRTVLKLLRTGSSPKLSYTPPSLSSGRVLYGGNCRVSEASRVNWLRVRDNSMGESTGGNAEDAATAVDRGMSGLEIRPTL